MAENKNLITQALDQKAEPRRRVSGYSVWRMVSLSPFESYNNDDGEIKYQIFIASPQSSGAWEKQFRMLYITRALKCIWLRSNVPGAIA